MLCIQNDVVCQDYFAFTIEMGFSQFFFSWWFEIVRFVQLLLNKILQMKKKLHVCQVWIMGHLRRNYILPLAWPSEPPTNCFKGPLGNANMTGDTEMSLSFHCWVWEVRSCCLLDELLWLFIFYSFWKRFQLRCIYSLEWYWVYLIV